MFTKLSQFLACFLCVFFIVGADLPDTILFRDINDQLINFRTNRLETEKQKECFKKSSVLANSANQKQPISLSISGQDFNNYLMFCKRLTEEESKEFVIQAAFGDYNAGIAILTALNFPLNELSSEKQESKKRIAESELNKTQQPKQARTEYQQKTSFIFKNEVILDTYDAVSQYLRDSKTIVQDPNTQKIISETPSVVFDIAEDLGNPKDIEIHVPMEISKETQEFLINYISFLMDNQNQPIDILKQRVIIDVDSIVDKISIEKHNQIVREALFFAHYMNLKQMEELLYAYVIKNIAFQARNLVALKLQTNPDYSTDDFIKYIQTNLKPFIIDSRNNLSSLIQALEIAEQAHKDSYYFNSEESKKTPFQLFYISLANKVKQYKSNQLMLQDIQNKSYNFDKLMQYLINMPQMVIQHIIKAFDYHLENARQIQDTTLERELFNSFIKSNNPYIIAASIVLQYKNSPNQKINFPFLEYSLQKILKSPYKYWDVSSQKGIDNNIFFSLRDYVESISALLKQIHPSKEIPKIKTTMLVDVSDEKGEYKPTGKETYASLMIKKWQKQHPGYFNLRVLNLSYPSLVNDTNRITSESEALAILMGKYKKDLGRPL